MRYYKFAGKGTEEQIRELVKSKEELRDYRYDSTLRTVNHYMYHTLKNDIGFMIYRAEADDMLLAVLYFDEKKETLEDAYEIITDVLKRIFHIQRVPSSLMELTMFEFVSLYEEAKRRECISYANSFIKASNLFIYDHYIDNEKRYGFEFDEKIIAEAEMKDTAIYDKKFTEELQNIEMHANHTEYKGNPVHYIISARSVEAACDMTEILAWHLQKANRIGSRRMEIISEMVPNLYKEDHILEKIIENNYGGVIVFDLSEKFGYDPVDYRMTCKYLEQLVKKYKKDCLFVFTYNMESPGFSYYLLPELKKYVIPVMLREGTGNRSSAVSYMQELIKKSEYAQYEDQAEEFMEQFPETEFSQTDVFAAYEQFEGWCLNKNVLQAYDGYDISEEFMLDRNEHAEDSCAKLDQMIGLKPVKEQIQSVIAMDMLEKQRKRYKGRNYQTSSMHMIFGGNPGTAKTTVARLFAGIAKEKGILKSGIFVERGGMELDGMGCTIEIPEAFAAAKGGVLFIDEAYSIKSDTAVTVLIREMENRRDDVIVILAGYHERMQDFMEINEGLKSRIPYWIDFPDYDTEELTDIFRLMLKERGFCATEDAVREAHYIFEKVRHTDNFGNGRYVRNLLERAIQKQSVRLLADRETTDGISKEDIFLLTKSDIGMPEEGLKDERIAGTARKELEEMIGLSSAKKIIYKAIANYKLRKLCMDKGIEKSMVSLHMVFTGNPGTAKTTVARLFAEIMKDEKVLPTGVFIEAGRADLVGDHVGATAPLVKRKFKEAQGGVLFIDEAYSLCDSYENGFGDEAINTLVQEMENHRDDVIVIFAGYPDKMQQFLERNPGMASRIAFHVEFDDYSVEELCDITKLMLSKKQMVMTDTAMEKLKKRYERARESSDYGNGRFVRKLLEEAEMNLAERVSQLPGTQITTQLLTTIEESDIPEGAMQKSTPMGQIGFAY